MANPLRKAQRLAERGNDKLGRITARLGTRRNPRGAVLTAYRAALRALTDILNRGGSIREVDDALDTLQRATEAAVREALEAGRDVGQELAVEQLDAYGIDATAPFVGISAALLAVMSEVSRQRQVVRAMVASGADPALIVGDGRRVGALRGSAVVQSASDWAAQLSNQAMNDTVAATPGTQNFQMQAIAALDERTTDCCLRVHGQIKEIDGLFILEGTPRFADEMVGPPFHNYCRTATALYHPAFEDGSTAEMRAGADTVLREREEGVQIERHPATAFDRGARRVIAGQPSPVRRGDVDAAEVADIVQTTPPTPIPFRRSRTPQEAAAWAREAGVEANYGNDLAIGNITNRAIARMQEAGYTIRNRYEVNDAIFDELGVNPNAPAFYRPSNNTVYFRSRANGYGFSPAVTRSMYEDGFWSSVDPRGIVYHETAHAYHTAARDIPLTASQRAIASEVSRYGMTDDAEFVAEVFAGHLSGHTYSDAVYSLYDEFNGPELR